MKRSVVIVLAAACLCGCSDPEGGEAPTDDSPQAESAAGADPAEPIEGTEEAGDKPWVPSADDIIRTGTPEHPVAPQITPPNWADAIGVIHTLESVTIADGEVCAVNERGELLIFSEEVSGDDTQITTADGAFPIGETILSGHSLEVPGGADCGGTH
ncbi:MAG: hypothetical protein Q4P33_00900, partial [Flaviflexus sp.]|nr:hypothetical protein [Flaviflexus sp.]